MIPDRYRDLVDELGVIAAEHDGTPAARIAELLAPFVVDVVSTDHGELAKDLPVPGLRVDRALEVAVATKSGLETLELALSETNRRIPSSAPAEESNVRLFGTPVVLADGWTVEKVRALLPNLPPGLDANEVVDKLARDGVLRRVGP